MRLLRVISSDRETSSAKVCEPPHLAAATLMQDAAVAVGGGPDHHRHGTDHGSGSKDDSFFEARPWLDSDTEDDFYSVRGDFTPSRGSTPDRQRQTPFIVSGRIPVDGSKPPSLVEKKQRRLLDLLQEKQHFDDEEDSATDISSDVEENSTVVVHAEEHLMKPGGGRKGGKVKRSSSRVGGCFPSLIWKHRFKMCRNVEKEQKPTM